MAPNICVTSLYYLLHFVSLVPKILRMLLNFWEICAYLVYWRIILKCILQNWNVGYGLDQAGSVYGQVTGSCECGNEPSVSVKHGEFHE